VPRNIGENDAQRGTDAVDGSKGYEPLPGADIGQCHPSRELRSVENAIRVAGDGGADRGRIGGIVCVAMV
jgi:hypothetical protein